MGPHSLAAAAVAGGGTAGGPQRQGRGCKSKEAAVEQTKYLRK